MSIQKYYKECIKLTPVKSLNSSLTPVTTYNESTINGYLGSGSNNPVQIADKDTYETLRKFYTSDLTITINDFIKYDGKTYEIVGDPQNTANKNHHIKCMVRKIDDIKQK